MCLKEQANQNNQDIDQGVLNMFPLKHQKKEGLLATGLKPWHDV